MSPPRVAKKWNRIAEFHIPGHRQRDDGSDLNSFAEAVADGAAYLHHLNESSF